MKRYGFDEAEVIKVKLVGTGKKCPVAELRADAGAPLIEINLPIINEFVAGVYSGAAIEELVDRPRNILCQTVNHFLLG